METVLVVNSSSEDEMKTCLVCHSEAHDIPDDMKMVTFVRDPDCRCRPHVCLSCQPRLRNCPSCRLPHVVLEESRQDAICHFLVYVKALYELILVGLIIDTLIEGSVSSRMDVIYCFTYLGFLVSCPREMLFLEMDERKKLIVKFFYYFSIAMMFRGTEVKLSLAIYSQVVNSLIMDFFG